MARVFDYIKESVFKFKKFLFNLFSASPKSANVPPHHKDNLQNEYSRQAEKTAKQKNIDEQNRQLEKAKKILEESDRVNDEKSQKKVPENINSIKNNSREHVNETQVAPQKTIISQKPDASKSELQKSRVALQKRYDDNKKNPKT